MTTPISLSSLLSKKQKQSTVDPRNNQRPRLWQIFTRFHEVLNIFDYFTYYWGKEHRSLCRGLRYKELRYIEVPL